MGSLAGDAERPRVLSGRAARTFYNAADALCPPEPGPGAGDVDLCPLLEERLAGRPVRTRALRLHLWLLEWQPRLRLQRGFSFLPRERRRALLAGWEASAFPPRRRAARALRRMVEELFAQSGEGA
jgi:hypothetical protein